MKLTLEPTEAFFMAGEVMVRLWKGVDQDGNELVALIAGVRMTDGSESEGLVPIPPPDEQAAERWARTILGPES